MWKSLVQAHIVVKFAATDHVNKKYITEAQHPKPKLLETCDCCHDEFSIRDVTYNGVQMLCNKCKKEII